MNTVALQTIPAELRKLRNWVLWRLEPDEKGKSTKMPYQVAHPDRKAASTRAATWATFDDAVAAFKAGHGDGIGFVVTGTKYAGMISTM